ncbi:hypothetical protein CI102_7717 [Trichoderma harzianum]|nr:hypothetical protein CI102_7717 [Trichoderma harzianum]
MRGRLVVEWVTISEHRLLYVFFLPFSYSISIFLCILHTQDCYSQNFYGTVVMLPLTSS